MLHASGHIKTNNIQQYTRYLYEAAKAGELHAQNIIKELSLKNITQQISIEKINTQNTIKNYNKNHKKEIDEAFVHIAFAG